MGSYKGKLSSLIHHFEKAHQRGGLDYGMFDRDIRKFIVSLLEDLRKNYESDPHYFGIIEVIEDFFNQMHNSLSGAGWMVWTAIDFKMFRELLSGEKVDYERLREIWDYYKHLNF